MTEYIIPSGESRAEYEVKRSRFLVTVRPVTSMDAMKRFIKEKREEHPKANHNCWALISGAPSNSNGYGFSDDGEPSGCAGKPIFTVLQHSGLGQVGIVVTRYFGGIKLGTGGMVKAYTEAAKAGVESVCAVPYSPETTLRISIDYAQEPLLRHLLEQHKLIKTDFQYDSGVTAVTTVRQCDSDRIMALLHEQLGHNTPIIIEGHCLQSSKRLN